MNAKNIGRLKNIKYNSETGDMELTLIITDNKFKKKILRDLALDGQIEIDGQNIMYTGNIRGNS